jgi:hypothetical protein
MDVHVAETGPWEQSPGSPGISGFSEAATHLGKREPVV